MLADRRPGWRAAVVERTIEYVVEKMEPVWEKRLLDKGYVSQQVVDAQSVPSLIAAGFGVSLVPQSIARFTTDEIAFRPIRPSPPPADVFLVYRKDETSMVVHNFITLARRILGSDPDPPSSSLRAIEPGGPRCLDLTVTNRPAEFTPSRADPT